MSKKAKTAAREKRKREKRARKEANRLRYASKRDAGTNTKEKSGDKTRRSTIRFHRHPTGACGNIGCKRCNK